MLRAINTSGGPVSAAPMPVREAQAADLPVGTGTQPNAVAAVEAVGPEPSTVSNVLVFRYSSSEFVYRQDVGRIVLIGQSPVTGERKIQIPSEAALRAYERTMRTEDREALLTSHAQPESEPVVSAAPAPTTTALPSLPQAVSAVLDANPGSAVVSVSA